MIIKNLTRLEVRNYVKQDVKMVTKNLRFNPVKKCWNCKSDFIYPHSNKSGYEIMKCGICGYFSRWDFDWEDRVHKACLILQEYEFILNGFEKSFLMNLPDFGCLSDKQEKIFERIWRKYM